jgi:hypothetical protein
MINCTAAAPILSTACALLAASNAQAASWSITPNPQTPAIYQISYDGPQYAALDSRASYLRLVTGPGCGWGTSIATMPSYWSQGKLHQGTAINVTWKISGPDLVLTCITVGEPLQVTETIMIEPPDNGRIKALVAANLTGAVPLDPRPGEAFKPVFLSSMHDSATSWDASDAFASGGQIALPDSGWIVPATPPTTTTVFGLTGGTSEWKKNSPTVTVTLNKPLQIAGWLTKESDPNGDNIGFWASSSTILSSWSYTIVASQASGP